MCVCVRACSELGGWVLPAHDLVGEEDATHLRVLVLTFVQDGLIGQRHRQEQEVRR